MAEPIDPAHPAMLAFNRYRQMMREHFKPFRPELVTWLNDYLQTPHPKKATSFRCHFDFHTEEMVCLVLVWYSDTMIRKTMKYFPDKGTPAPPLTNEEARAECLHRSLVISAGLGDLVADVWQEIGSSHSFLPFGIDGPPDLKENWLERVYDWIRMQIESFTPRVPSEPEPAPNLPARRGVVSVEILAACQMGGGEGLLAWADALAATNDAEGAALLRWLPGFRQSVAAIGVERIVNGSFFVRAGPDGTAWGFDGVEQILPGQREASLYLGRVFTSWNDYHPALEWLLRNLALWQVKIGASRKTLNLDIGDHLAPTETPVGLLTATCDLQRVEARQAAEALIHDLALRAFGRFLGSNEIPGELINVDAVPETARLAANFYSEWDESSSWSGVSHYRVKIAKGSAFVVHVYTEHSGTVEVYSPKSKLWGAGAHLHGAVVWNDLNIVRQQLVNSSTPFEPFYHVRSLEWIYMENACMSIGGRFLIFMQPSTLTPQWLFQDNNPADHAENDVPCESMENGQPWRRNAMPSGWKLIEALIKDVSDRSPTY